MFRYLLVRVVEIIPVVFFITVASFLLIHLVPGDPAQILLGRQATPAAVSRLHAELGLDKSLPSQYWNFVQGAATFDFGTSIQTGEDVGSLISRRMGPSFVLIGYALVVTLLLAVPLALVSATRRGTWVDGTIRLISTITFVMPVFWMALVLVTVFSLKLGIFPTSGYGDNFPEHIRALTLPAITLGLSLSPLLMRVLRSSLIDTMHAEYIEAAHARGLSNRRVLLKHVLRNSTTSTVTLVGFLFAVLLSATVVVEQIFGLPGLGSLLISAVERRDLTVVQALTLLFAIVVLTASLVTDLIYAVLDPRVRL